MLRAISNSIIHETAAHHFGTTPGHAQDQMYYARDSGWANNEHIRARYGTVADSYSYTDLDTRGKVTGGPIPVHPEDQEAMQQKLRPEHVEPPDYE